MNKKERLLVLGVLLFVVIEQLGERVFYTTRNAKYIDTARKLIGEIPEPYRTYLLAPLLYEASVHNNTSGVFKGFYKNSKTGIGQYGGDGKNALLRIKSDIELRLPIQSNDKSKLSIHKMLQSQNARFWDFLFSSI